MQEERMLRWRHFVRLVCKRLRAFSYRSAKKAETLSGTSFVANFLGTSFVVNSLGKFQFVFYIIPRITRVMIIGLKYIIFTILSCNLNVSNTFEIYCDFVSSLFVCSFVSLCLVLVSFVCFGFVCFFCFFRTFQTWGAAYL